MTDCTYNNMIVIRLHTLQSEDSWPFVGGDSGLAVDGDSRMVVDGSRSRDNCFRVDGSEDMSWLAIDLNQTVDIAMVSIIFPSSQDICHGIDTPQEQSSLCYLVQVKSKQMCCHTNNKHYISHKRVIQFTK